MEEKIYHKIDELLNRREQAAVVTIVNATPGTPRKVGAKMLVLPDGSITGTIGGGGLEKQLIEAAVKVCVDGTPVLINKDLSAATGEIGAVCGGQIAVFIEPILKTSLLYIFGAGHVGKAIADFARHLEFSVNVIDDRPEWANRENYPEPCRLWTGDVFKLADDIKTDDNTYIIILTRSWKMDESVLKRVLRKKHAYIGVIGSKNKIKTHFENLVALGFKNDDFKNVYAPVGIPIGAYSPHEIAISILAEIIAVQKGKRGSLPFLEGAIYDQQVGGRVSL